MHPSGLRIIPLASTVTKSLSDALDINTFGRVHKCTKWFNCFQYQLRYAHFHKVKLYFMLPPVKLGFFAPKRPNLAQNMHFLSFRAKYWPFWSIWCHARPKKQGERGTRTFAPKMIRMIGPKLAILPQNMLYWAHRGLAGSFGDLLVGWSVVVVHGLYLARHLFTLSS